MIFFKRNSKKELEANDLFENERLIKVCRPIFEPSEEPQFIGAAPLTKEEEQKYQLVLEYFQKDELLLPNTESKGDPTADGSPLSLFEKAWLTRECIIRFLHATKWVPQDAIERLTETIGWRRQYGIANYGGLHDDKLNADIVAIENETGKQVVLGFDRMARPILYLKPGRQNTQTSKRQVQHLVFMLERVLDFMPPGQASLTLLVDFKDSGGGPKIHGYSKIPPLSVGKEVLHILQMHYPERLGKALLTNIPWIALTFIKMIHPFIDPTTREKLAIEEDLDIYVDPHQLDKVNGGYLDFTYEHDVYWPSLLEMAAAKRQHYLKRFEELGSTIGLSEYDLRGRHEIANGA